MSDKRYECNTRAVPLLAICAIGLSSTMAQQVSTPANAFLDVRVPVSPMTLRVGGRPQLVYELHSNGAYGDIMPRVAGLFMFVLGGVIVQFVRARDYRLPLHHRGAVFYCDGDDRCPYRKFHLGNEEPIL